MSEIHVRGNDILGPVDYKIIMKGGDSTTGYIRDQFGNEQLIQEDVLFHFINVMAVAAEKNFKKEIRRDALEKIIKWANNWLERIENE